MLGSSAALFDPKVLNRTLGDVLQGFWLDPAPRNDAAAASGDAAAGPSGRPFTSVGLSAPNHVLPTAGRLESLHQPFLATAHQQHQHQQPLAAMGAGGSLLPSSYPYPPSSHFPGGVGWGAPPASSLLTNGISAASFLGSVDLTADGNDAGAGGGGSGRIQMSCPTIPRASVARLTARNKNKHRRLFDGGTGALKDGDAVTYIMHGERLLTGTVVIRDKGASGILCDHCNAVISCSAFEAHAGHGQRRNPYDGITTAEGLTLRQIASKLQPLPDHYTLPESLAKRKSTGKRDATGALAQIADRCRDVLGQLDTLASSCVICYQTDFDKDGFSDRTVIICDQCEREYHVGCLRNAGRCNLQALPEGEWFCCAQCASIRQTMSGLVASGEVACSSCSSSQGEYTWQIMRGKAGGDASATAKALKQTQESLQESFDPIIDVTTRQDLMPKMILAQTLGEFDFQGMYSILLKHRGKPVCAALLRIFGSHLAELPLVATRMHARRQGHCRVLMNAIEALLQQLGVGVLSLPAAYSAMSTWINSFQFRPIEPHDLQAVQSELRLLMFPGSQMLYKTLGPPPPEGPFAFAGHTGQVQLAAAGSIQQQQQGFPLHPGQQQQLLLQGELQQQQMSAAEQLQGPQQEPELSHSGAGVEAVAGPLSNGPGSDGVDVGRAIGNAAEPSAAGSKLGSGALGNGEATQTAGSLQNGRVGGPHDRPSGCEAAAAAALAAAAAPDGVGLQSGSLWNVPAIQAAQQPKEDLKWWYTKEPSVQQVQQANSGAAAPVMG